MEKSKEKLIDSKILFNLRFMKIILLLICMSLIFISITVGGIYYQNEKEYNDESSKCRITIFKKGKIESETWTPSEKH